MVSKEIEELTKERHSIEAEVAQKEADIRIKTGEMRSLESEFNTLTATLKQLETQRGAAQTRLDDLTSQVRSQFLISLSRKISFCAEIFQLCFIFFVDFGFCHFKEE